MKILFWMTLVFLAFSIVVNWWMDNQIKDFEETILLQQLVIKQLIEREEMLSQQIVEILKKRGENVMDLILLNGKPRCTLIQRFNGELIVVGPGASSKEIFKRLLDAEKAIEKRGWVISVIHPTPKKQEV